MEGTGVKLRGEKDEDDIEIFIACLDARRFIVTVYCDTFSSSHLLRSVRLSL